MRGDACFAALLTYKMADLRNSGANANCGLRDGQFSRSLGGGGLPRANLILTTEPLTLPSNMESMWPHTLAMGRMEMSVTSAVGESASAASTKFATSSGCRSFWGSYVLASCLKSASCIAVAVRPR